MGTRDLLNYTILPAIFDRADAAFPELQFKRSGQDWHSPLKLDGMKPQTPRNDKTVITARLPSRLLEQGGNSVSFWDYVAERYGLTQNKDVLEKLADLAEISLPSLDPEALGRIEAKRRAADLWAAIADYCQDCLQKTEDPGAKAAREYLAGRGYKPEHIAAMGLGFLPSRAPLFSYLAGKKYEQSEIDGLKNQLEKGVDGTPFSSSWGIGETHKLVIPYTASGRIIGIAARALGEEKPKYLYPSGEGWRRPELFNLNAVKGAKDLVIVEGLLDALAASVIAGIPDVVALGDSSGFNRERIEEAKRWGARKITLCLDNDEGGRGGTERALQALKEHAPDLPVYVVTLPEGVKDPDELIKAEGPDALKKAIENATHYWEYLGGNIIKEHAPEPGEYETAKEADEIVEALERIAADITSPAERDTAYNLFTEALSPYGITKESFKKAAEAIREKGRLEKQDRALKALLKGAGKLQDEGKEKEALDLLQKRSRELKAGGADYSGLLVTVKESDIREIIKQQPESLKSGYKIGGDELLFPAGALSILAGPTSHGKTALLLNVLLNASEAYPEKKFYLFSYEESREAVLIKALSSYAGIELSNDNKRTIRSHYRGDDSYFSGKKAPADFLTKKETFFRDLIEGGRLNVHYADYQTPELIDAIRYLKEHGNAGAVFIDYMQLLKKPGRFGARQEELKEICLDLKDIAIETGLPVILAAQFNRTVVSPLDLHATNIGEAGDIERAANLILGIWKGDFRPVTDKADKAELEKLGFDSETLLKKGKLYVQMLKNRDGEAGKTGWLDFNGNTGKIINDEAPAQW